jgi:energy-converting hydrogenase Eha subunit A
MNARVLLAFLLAPALLPGAVLGLAAVLDPSRESLRAGVAYAAILCIFTYGVALVLGLPLFYWFRREGWSAAHHYLLAGGALGLVPLLLIALLGRIPLSLPPVMALAGGLSALVFRFIAGRHGSSTHVA